ncbi:MAG: response regulator [Desulfobulbaceae bacterium]|nr:response regulator [Desulfobulbaceae bacterium]
MVAKLRTKSILSIIFVILTISACYLFYYGNKQEENVQLLIDSRKSQIRTLMPFHANQIDQQYSARIISFVQQRERIIGLFAARNRSALYEETLPYYLTLQKENSYFDHLDFILPDKTLFLSMHDKGEKTLQYSHLSLESYDSDVRINPPNSGYALCQSGLCYAVMLPVVRNNEEIGMLLFGIKIGSIIEDLQKNLGIQTALALTGLPRQAGTGYQEIPDGNFDLFPYGDPFFKSKAAEIDISREEQTIAFNDADMVVFPSYIIRDRKGEEIGRILQAVNLTDLGRTYRDDLLRLALVTLTVILIACFILHGNFDKVLSELMKLNTSLVEKNQELRDSEKRLETLVAVRTEDLEKANFQLQQEIKGRRDANLSLSRSVQEWQSTFDAITDPVTILDKDLKVVVANKAANELLTRREGVIIGRKCYELFVGSITPCATCPAADVVQTGEQREYKINHSHLGKSLVVTCAPIYDGKEFLGFVHTARDVTEEKKLKKQLAQAQKMEAIATLAGGIAHDFNNILGAILGNADLLLYRLSQKPAPDIGNRDEVTPEDIVAHLEAIKKAGNRAKDLVSQILAFSRQGKSQRQNADVTPVVKEGIKLLRSSLPSNIEIRYEADAEICQVNADLSQVHQVFMNLCTNSAQAMAMNGGILDISLRLIEPDDVTRQSVPELKPDHLYVALSVKDTGHGMSPGVMERIFDPFFTTKDVSEGTGMGLAVIHGIITAHGGELNVQSEEGVGSEFTVFFPCIDSQKQACEDAILGVPRGSEKILFVDDEEDILRMSTRMLEYLGYTVYSAISAEKAFAMLTREDVEVDLIITDYSMPGITGVQLARKLLEAGINTPVILCSGFSDSVILEQTARRGIRKFMSKPLDMKKLAGTIREVLEPSRRRMNADSDN